MNQYIYLTEMEVAINSEVKTLYKIGKTSTGNTKRIKSYGNECKNVIINHNYRRYCPMLNEVERIIIRELNLKFKCVRGREWFEGDMNEIKNTVNNRIKKIESFPPDKAVELFMNMCINLENQYKMSNFDYININKSQPIPEHKISVYAIQTPELKDFVWKLACCTDEDIKKKYKRDSVIKRICPVKNNDKIKNDIILKSIINIITDNLGDSCERLTYISNYHFKCDLDILKQHIKYAVEDIETGVESDVSFFSVDAKVVRKRLLNDRNKITELELKVKNLILDNESLKCKYRDLENSNKNLNSIILNYEYII